jgi:hypothetical protein
MAVKLPATNVARDLIDGLLDKDYVMATREVLRAIAAYSDNPALRQRYNDLTGEAYRLQLAGKPLEADNPVLMAFYAEFEKALQAQAKLIDAAAPRVQDGAFDVTGQFVKRLATQGLDDDALAKLGIRWNVPRPEQIKAVVDYTTLDSWTDTLGDYTTDVMDAARNTVLRGIIAGQNPTQTARDLRQVVTDLPVFQANQILRTLQLTASRDADVMHRVANQDIIAYAIRIATLDRRVCASCVALHGTKLEVNRRVDDHHNGRCTSITQIKGLPEYNIESGEVWFARLPEDWQKDILGGAGLRAYKAGRVRLADFSHAYQDPVFGRMIGTRSLKQILGPEARKFYAGYTPPTPNTSVGNSQPITHAQLADDHEKTMGFAEKRSIKRYVANGYQRINNDLRVQRGNLDNIRPGVVEHIQNLDAVTHDHTLPQPITVYRGINQWGLRDMGGLKEGQTFTDYGFVSTTMSRPIAEKRIGPGGALIQMDLLKGQRGAAIKGINLEGESEQEILLPRGQRYRVTRIDRSGDMPIVHVEVLHG